MLGVAFHGNRKRFSIWQRNEELQKMTKRREYLIDLYVTHMSVVRMVVVNLWDGLMLRCRNIGMMLAGLCYPFFFITCVIAMSMLRHAMQHTASGGLLLHLYQPVDINSECAAYPL
ncbi:hypothetical protein V8C34DRAFT_278568 [Trichoderma compactum]